MIEPRFILSLLAVCTLSGLLLLTGTTPAVSGGVEVQTIADGARSSGDPLGDRAWHTAPAETLSYMVESGQVLILNLPSSFGTTAVESYRIKQAPALSWLVERSYFWRTLAKDVGEHRISFEARSAGRPIEEVVVLVDVR